MSPRQSVYQLLTSSRLKAYRRCQRYHQIRYVDGYRPVVEREVLRFGSLGHLGLERWWTELMLDPAIDADVLLERTLAAVDGEPDPYTRVKVQVLLEGYHHRWLDAGLVPLAVEVQFECALVNPLTGAPSKIYRLGGKLDVIARDRDGRVLIVEHKFSGEDVSTGSTYWTRLRMDGQVSTYFDGATALGHEVAGCIYDVIGKPDIRPKKATPVDKRRYTKAGALDARQRDTDETPEEYADRLRAAVAEDPGRYYARGEVVRLEQDLLGHRLDMWALAEQMRDRRRSYQPKNPDACVAYGSTCEFFDVCSSAASLDDAARFVRLEDVHPELAPAAAAVV